MSHRTPAHRAGPRAPETTSPLGLESGIVEVVPYDPRWSDAFAEAARELHAALAEAARELHAALAEAARELHAALGSSILAVHHVGSTAVPGLCAKPILDILVSVPDFEASLELVPRFEALGYEFRADEEIADRHYFRRRRGTATTHHLSLAEPTSHHHRVTIAFRDALRADPALARRYGALKTELAGRFPRDRAAYIAGKSAFVGDVLGRAGVDDARGSWAGGLGLA